MSSQDVLTFAASLLGSGVLAAMLATRGQRQSQLREQMIAVASDFAGTTMRVLAALRRYKPTKPGVRQHRNAPLLTDRELRRQRYDELQLTFDQLRGLRGRVRLHFPGTEGERSAITDRADAVVGALRDASDASERFWKRCDAEPRRRREFERKYEAEYQAARHQAWADLDEFCNLAAQCASRPDRGSPRSVRLRRRFERRHRGIVAPAGANVDPTD
jgi:hypothetical protein